MIVLNIFARLVKIITLPFVLIYGLISGLIRYNTKVFQPTPATRFIPKNQVRVDYTTTEVTFRLSF